MFNKRFKITIIAVTIFLLVSCGKTDIVKYETSSSPTIQNPPTGSSSNLASTPVVKKELFSPYQAIKLIAKHNSQQSGYAYSTVGYHYDGIQKNTRFYMISWSNPGKGTGGGWEVDPYNGDVFQMDKKIFNVSNDIKPTPSTTVEPNTNIDSNKSENNGNKDFIQYIGEYESSDNIYENGGSVLNIKSINGVYMKGEYSSIQTKSDKVVILDFEGKIVDSVVNCMFIDSFDNRGIIKVTFSGENIAVENNISSSKQSWYPQNGNFKLKDKSIRAEHIRKVKNEEKEDLITIDNKLKIVKEEEVRKIKKGMSYKEVVEILGTSRDIGSGVILYEYSLEGRKTFYLSIADMNQKIEQSGEDLIYSAK